MRLVRWAPSDLARRMEDVLVVFGEAMSYDRQMLEVRRGYITTHLRRPQFRAVATLDDDDSLVGFGYGYLSQQGQWWHEQVRDALTEDDRQRWLALAFEIVELHVHPRSQGKGLGEAQLRQLLADAPGRVALLSTPEADETASRAWRLYRRNGFSDVVRHLIFPGDPRPFAVLGRDLPMPAPS
ncbi:GNAT family N-acetyltransferase [Catelliglobosispora koreensis]|uniref:GNAT family N-acetyltransferase n=1 Tax=Catelliglobosispora koreensis TaxID=129052 RepID=UPI00037CB7AA|nr:GNAT family N-acetyltransferase [Catelliglobosispora koreensis]